MLLLIDAGSFLRICQLTKKHTKQEETLLKPDVSCQLKLHISNAKTTTFNLSASTGPDSVNGRIELRFPLSH
jgi:hypothetical protein